MKDNQLYLIDGHALVYRAYFAMIKNPLINSKGQPTSAVFGFANYLIRLIDTYQCPYMAIVMDSNKPTFRHTAYEQYKAHREAMPDDLRAQLPLINELISAFNLPVVKKDGFEADDLIAVLTEAAVKSDYDVFLVTKDKDLMQLIGPNVKMLAPEGTGVFTTFGINEVIEKMGVPPEKIVDYLALIGDASDNIPGVPGVGPKTAIKILELGGSVDRILENTSILENAKLIQKIEENRELLVISKMLATLKTDIETGFTLDQLKRRSVNRELCLTMFRDLEFTSLLKHPMFGGAPRHKPLFKIAKSLSDVDSFIESIRKKGSVSLDFQTTSLLARGAELVGISLATETSEALYIPVGHKETGNLDTKDVLDKLQEIFESKDIKKIGQNLKYECQILRNYGICLDGCAFDTMIAAYLIDPGKRQYEIDILAGEWLHIEIAKIETLIGKDKLQRNFSDVGIEEAAPYAAEIVTIPLLLQEKLEPILNERKLRELFENIEMPLVAVLGDMEWQGILVDTTLLSEMSKKYGAELEVIANDIYAMAGEPLNLNSPKQVGEVLFGKLGLPGTKKTKTGGHSTNFDELEKLGDDYPIVKRILEHREVQKLLSTYIDALPGQILRKSGRIHSSFNQTVAATGRLSSTNPNLQNIPIRTEAGKKIREVFIAAPGNTLVVADYSQIELRILAHLSNDPFLIEAFKEDKDIHTQTASVIYQVFPEMVTSEMRRSAKTINFGLMYGMGPINLARQLKISFHEAKAFIETYFRQFPTIRSYMDTSISKARELGFTETLLGRRRYLPEMNASNRNIREAAERTAINTPVQGTAADIIKIAMINIQKEMRTVCPDSMLLLQVHDELVFEVPSSQAATFKEWVVEKMAGAYVMSVPIKVDSGIGAHWGEAK